MKRYKGTAFLPQHRIDDLDVIGNFAVVYFLEDDEDFDKDVMSELGLKENAPMTCFVKKRADGDFDISFWNLDGSQAFMCGHGSIITAGLLNRLHNINDISIYFDKSHYKKDVDNRLNMTVQDDGLVLMEAKMCNIEIIKKEDFTEEMKQLMEFMSLKMKDLDEAFMGVELRDLTFVVKDPKKMRTMDIEFRKIAPVLDKMEIRNLCTTAISADENFDFETRVFCPHDNLDEDTACGSSNLSVAKYWGEKLGKKDFRVLFPYHVGYDDKKAGGVQAIRLENDRVLVGGFCE